MSESPIITEPKGGVRPSPITVGHRPLSLAGAPIGGRWRPNRRYRGWLILALSVTSITLALGSTLYAFGLFIPPISKELGLSRAAANGALIFYHLGMAVVAPVMGWLLDRYSIRTLMALGGVALGGSCFVLATGDAVWPKLAVLLVAMPIGLTGAGVLANYILLVRWFRTHRARALVIATFGQPISAILIPPLLALLIDRLGWRGALWAWGTVLVIAIFAISRVVRNRPGDDDIEPAKRVTELSHGHAQELVQDTVPATYRVILTRIDFWVLAIIISIALAVQQTLLVSLIPLATGRGLSLSRAATLMTIVGISSAVGLVLLGIFGDRIDRKISLGTSIVLLGLFAIGLAMPGGYLWLSGCCVIGGIATSTIFPSYSVLVADRLGAASMGTAEGLFGPMIAGSAAVAIYCSGRSFDLTHSYATILVIFAGALAVALMLLFALGVWSIGGGRGDEQSLERE